MSDTGGVIKDQESLPSLSRRGTFSVLGLVGASLLLGPTVAKAAPGPLFIQGGNLVPPNARLSGQYFRQFSSASKAMAPAVRELSKTLLPRLASLQLAIWAEADTNTGRNDVENDNAVGVIQYSRSRIAEGYFAEFGLTSADQALNEETAFLVAAKRINRLLECPPGGSPVVNGASIEVLQRLATSSGDLSFKNAFGRLVDREMIIGARALHVDRSTSLDCGPIR